MSGRIAGETHGAVGSTVRRAGAAALSGLAVYCAVLLGLWWSQESLLFHPQPLPASHRFDMGADVHETWVDVSGARLNALHLRLPRPDGVVFFLHGNAGNLQGWFGNADFYRRANFDLFMVDYRGFGKSSGRIESQAQLEADVLAAWQQMAAQYAGSRRVIVGQSLGTGLAAILAAQVQPDLTVLVSPYSSMVAVASQHHPWVPGALLRYPLRTDRALPQVQGPVLLLHGGRDDLLPAAHSHALQRLAPTARMLLVDEAGHNDIDQFPNYRDALRAALQGR